MPSFDYSYDHPTRSTSPLHFLNPTATMSHLTSHCSSHSKPSVSAAASKAADISRLLDPSYLPSSSSRASPTFTKAYVDPNGDLHDPDYRHFPTQAKQYSLNSTYSHSSSSSSGSATRGSTSTARRPHFDWEIDLDESALDDDYEHTEDWQQRNKYAAPSRSWSTSSQRPRESSFSTTSMYTPSSTYYSPTGTASTLPTSYEDDVILSESPFDETVHALQREKEQKERKHRRRLSKGDREKERARLQEEKEKALRQEEEEKEVQEMRQKIEIQEEETHRQRRRSLELQQPSAASGRSRRSRQQPQMYEEDDEDAFATAPENDDDDSAQLHPPSLISRVRSRSLSRSRSGAEGEYVPTCTQSLKRQWQAFALGFRFGVFRAQRRVMRRVASLM